MTSYLRYDDIIRALTEESKLHDRRLTTGQFTEALEKVPAIYSGQGVTKLQIIRNIKGMSMLDLEKKSGVSMETISAHEKRHRIARKSTLTTLADALGVPVQMIEEDKE